MSEIWLRVAILGMTLLGVAVVVLVMRRSRPVEGRSISDLAPGIYLFTSSTCADCIGVREQLIDALGSRGFAEIEWEEDPEIFTRAGIDVVPCTVVVAEDGTSSRHPGMPGDLLERFNP